MTLGRTVRAAVLAAVLGTGALGTVGPLGSDSGAATAWGIALPQAVPSLPSGTVTFGAAPATHEVELDVVLADPNAPALAQAAAAVSTPGSPGYRHYLSAAQFAAQFGPPPSDVGRVAQVLRDQGLTVGSPLPGSLLLPVGGTAAAVSAAFGTPLESVQVPGGSRTVVNTGTLRISPALAGAVTGVVGLDGVFAEHAKLVADHARAGAATPGTPGPPSGATPADASPSGASIAHASVPQACPAAQAQASGGAYTSTQLSSVFGLDQLFAQGRTGVGQTIAVVEFEQYLASDFHTFEACFGLTNPVHNVLVDGGSGGPPDGVGEAALDTEVAAVNAPSSSLVVYEAPNGDSDKPAMDLFNQIASDDVAQVVTTSWGDCEAAIPSPDRSAESAIFARMALQGQTVIAASGDSGSEDCLHTQAHVAPGTRTGLAADDPGAQPDVVSAGGTSLPTPSASSQTVWNCSTCGLASGAGGGGYSISWPRTPGQPAPAGFPGSGTDPCGLGGGCRAVPDLSYPSDPAAGAVVAYSSHEGGWTAFGGTSVAAPANAGLFADVNQGCFAHLGAVGPALYGAATADSATFTDISRGDNDFTGGNFGLFAAVSGTGVSGYDAATGLGSPVDENLSSVLQGGDGCPSVSSVSPDRGPIAGGGEVTISGGGLGDATSVSFGSVGPGQIVSRSSGSLTVVPPAARGPQCVDVTVTNPRGASAASAADHYGYGGDLNCGQGYRFVASDGGIFSFGDAAFFGSTGDLTLNAPVVAMAGTPSTDGYWLVASDGGIFSFGDATFYGSMGGRPLNEPIVGMAATPDGGGYWLVASDGGIFSFGDAPFYGSTGGIALNRPIVGMAATPDGGGYWLVASDGGIFSFGDASFDGSMGGRPLNEPIVGMAATTDGGGYWLVASDGGIFSFGDAPFYGSAGALRLNAPVVGMAATPGGGGYWLVASDGGVFTYGDAQFYGSTGGLTLNRPVVGLSSA